MGLWIIYERKKGGKRKKEKSGGRKKERKERGRERRKEGIERKKERKKKKYFHSLNFKINLCFNELGNFNAAVEYSFSGLSFCP